MEWDDLKIIDALDKAKSLSGAARALNVNHSTVYRRLGRLEAELGVRLFERFRDGYQPTPSGEEVLAVAHRTKTAIGDLERKLTGRDLRLEGRLTISTSDTLQEYFMPLIAAFKTDYPGVDVELVMSNKFANLSKRDCDIALRASNTPPDRLVGMRFGRIPSAIYAATRYLEAQADRRNYLNYDWIGFDDTLAHLEAARWLEKSIPPEKIVLRANSLNGISFALREGLGAAILPCFLTFGMKDIQSIVEPMEQLETDLWLLTHEDIRHTGRVRAFMEFAAGNKHYLAGLLQSTPPDNGRNNTE